MNRRHSAVTLPETPIHARPQAKRTCPYCGHHTLMAKGQILVCRSCSQTLWRSES